MNLARIEAPPDGRGLRFLGPWTLAGINGLDARLPALDAAAIDDQAPLDASGIDALDTGGALFLLRTLRRFGPDAERRLRGLREEHRALLALVAERAELSPPAPAPPEPVLARLGRAVIDGGAQGLAFLSFVGAVSLALGRVAVDPRRLRGRALSGTLHSAGVAALPIIGLMSFLLGVVIAYQGGLQLKTYGANIFIVELVSLTMLRELAPLIAAIMVAGRTGSAFTAQIGTMRVTEEIDALRTIGIDPLDMLVLPKLLALLIALPLLTVFADLLSVFGGMVTALLLLGVSLQDFLNRIPQAVTATSFLIGVGKAPVFAAIIVLVGCFQGFLVSASAESVGRRTTVSVVQSIFLVIVADAGFSVLFGVLGI